MATPSLTRGTDPEHAAACVAACEGIHPAAVPLLLAACKRVLAELRDGGDVSVGAEEDLEDALNVAGGEVG